MRDDRERRLVPLRGQTQEFLSQLANQGKVSPN
jgi:hypothetical protein